MKLSRIDAFYGIMQWDTEYFPNNFIITDQPGCMQCVWSINSKTRYAEEYHLDSWDVFIWGSMRDINQGGKVIHANTIGDNLHAGEKLEQILQGKEGEFIVATWDKANRTGYLSTDPLGHVKLFYSEKKNSIVFASHPRLITPLDTSEKISKEGLELLLSLRVIPSPYSIIQDVFKLAPGQILVIGDNYHEYVDYYSPFLATEINNDIPLLQAASLLMEKLSTVIERNNWDNDQIAGLFLSGGLDSGLLLGLISELGIPVENFTVSYYDQDSNDESRIAKRTAKAFNLPITVFKEKPSEILKLIQETISYLPEPVGDISFYPQLWMALNASERASVIFDGTGADNLFGGLNKIKAETYLNLLYSLPGIFRERLLPGVVNTLPSSRKSPLTSMVRRARKLIEGSRMEYLQRQVYWTRLLSKPIINEIMLPEWHCENDICDNLLMSAYFPAGDNRKITSSSIMSVRGVLPYTSLYKLNMIESLTGLSIRLPYLAPDFVQFSLGLPDTLKVKGHQVKYILRKTADIYFPKELRRRHPGNFTPPMRLWIKRELREFFVSEILEDGPFNPEYLKKMIRDQFDDKNDWLLELWVIFMFQAWAKQNTHGNSFALLSNQAQ